MELTQEQILLITAIVVPLITQILKLMLAWQGKEVSKAWVTTGAFVISIGLALWWWMPQLPASTDPMEYTLSLLGAASTVLGGATLIYNILLTKLFERYGATKEAMFERMDNAPAERTDVE